MGMGDTGKEQKRFKTNLDVMAGGVRRSLISCVEGGELTVAKISKNS